MSQYAKVELQRVPSTHAQTQETRYWKRFKLKLKQQYNAPITDFHFSAVSPHDFAVSCSTRVTIINPKTCTARKTISRFKNVAYSGSFRADGKLLVAGCEDKRIRVFDLDSRTILRTFRGHKNPVHVTRFNRDDVKIVSASDDCTLKTWDLAMEKHLTTLRGHTDYVRCAVQTSSPHTWISGSYDRTLKIWDVRSKECSNTFNQGTQVHVLLAGLSEDSFVAAGDNQIKIWDPRGGTGDRAIVNTFSSHQKQITGLCWAMEGKRLLSCSLDQHVKLYDSTTWTVVHSMKFEHPLMSLGVSPDDTTLVVGSVTGEMLVRRRVKGEVKTPTPALPKLTLLAPDTKEARDAEDAEEEPGSISALASAALRARGLQPSKDAELDKRLGNAMVASGAMSSKPQTKSFFGRGTKTAPQEDDIMATMEKKKPKLKPYDIALKKFEYAEALDAALATRRSVVVASVIQELVVRGDDALRRALRNKTDTEIAPLMEFLVQSIGNPNFASVAMDTARVVLDLYGKRAGESLLLDEQLAALHRRITAEFTLQKQLALLSGSLEMILASEHCQQTMHPTLMPLQDEENFLLGEEEDEEEDVVMSAGTTGVQKLLYPTGKSSKKRKTSNKKANADSTQAQAQTVPVGTELKASTTSPSANGVVGSGRRKSKSSFGKSPKAQPKSKPQQAEGKSKGKVSDGVTGSEASPRRSSRKKRRSLDA